MNGPSQERSKAACNNRVELDSRRHEGGRKLNQKKKKKKSQGVVGSLCGSCRCFSSGCVAIFVSVFCRTGRRTGMEPRKLRDSRLADHSRLAPRASACA